MLQVKELPPKPLGVSFISSLTAKTVCLFPYQSCQNSPVDFRKVFGFSWYQRGHSRECKGQTKEPSTRHLSWCFGNRSPTCPLKLPISVFFPSCITRNLTCLVVPLWKKERTHPQNNLFIRIHKGQMENLSPIPTLLALEQTHGPRP